MFARLLYRVRELLARRDVAERLEDIMEAAR